MTNIFFTSDHHLGHGRIVDADYADRPVDKYEHTEFLTTRWNERVGPEDTVFHLGDFTLGNRERAKRYFSGLNGTIFVLGNNFHHDSRWLPHPHEVGWSEYITRSESSVIILPPINVFRPKVFVAPGVKAPYIVLCHYPFRRWDRCHYGSWHLYGHTHQKDNPRVQGDFSLNVGVDAWDYYPVPLDTIATEMIARGWHENWREYE